MRRLMACAEVRKHHQFAGSHKIQISVAKEERNERKRKERKKKKKKKDREGEGREHAKQTQKTPAGLLLSRTWTYPSKVTKGKLLS